MRPAIHQQVAAGTRMLILAAGARQISLSAFNDDITNVPAWPVAGRNLSGPADVRRH
jgi:hypothetical protein